MHRKFVKLLLDIHCNWEEKPPVYRIYVNDELFSERTFYWKDSYLQEILQIEAEPGIYLVRLEPVGQGNFSVKNRQVELGPARWIDDTAVEIHNRES